MKLKTFPENKSIHGLHRVKFGIDPTFSRLHIGHLVSLLKAKEFHKEHRDVTIVLGTLTAQFGDPTGRDKTRPILEEWVVRENADMLEHQIRKIIPGVRIVKNGDLHKNISVISLMKIVSSHTVSSILQRHGFQKRESVMIHEILVPFLQAMDSVILETQLEIGGEDQLFNFSLTRDIQKQHNQYEEVTVLLPIVRGTDGNKMSKSLGNCIFLDTEPNEMKNQILSISDSVMDEWFPIFCRDAPKEHPFERKKQLADTIINLLHEKKHKKL